MGVIGKKRKEGEKGKFFSDWNSYEWLDSYGKTCISDEIIYYTLQVCDRNFIKKNEIYCRLKTMQNYSIFQHSLNFYYKLLSVSNIYVALHKRYLF